MQSKASPYVLLRQISVSTVAADLISVLLLLITVTGPYHSYHHFECYKNGPAILSDNDEPVENQQWCCTKLSI